MSKLYELSLIISFWLLNQTLPTKYILFFGATERLEYVSATRIFTMLSNIDLRMYTHLYTFLYLLAMN